jgi:sugar lactone lactonase YvrE
VLVPAEPTFDLFNGDCYKLGLRVDPRTNYLFVARCQVGNAFVFDAETGEELAQYQLASFGTVINDLAIARRAVYFTDFTGPFLYQLPLSKNGDLPRSDAASAIPLIGSDATDELGTPQTANGIVLMADNKTLVIGDSSTAQIYRVDPKTGMSDRIILDTPLVGFIDGIIRDERRLYILTPADPEDPTDVDRIQVVKLDKDMLTGKLMGIITDEDLDGVASGAILGSSLYVNNARYTTFPEADTDYWLTKLKIKSTSWNP